MRYFNIIFLLIITTSTLFALEEQVGVIKAVEGKVYRVTPARRDEQLNKGDAVYGSDLIDTKKGKIKIKFNDETEILLAKKTKLRIKKYSVKPSESKRFAILKLIKGDLKVNVKRKFGNNLFELSSGYITLEIKGTKFFLSNHSGNVKVLLTEGILSVKSDLDKFNKLKLTPNKKLEVRGESLPVISSVTMSELRNFNSKFEGKKVSSSSNIKKFKNYKEGEIKTSANKYISQMRGILSKAYESLKRVRKEKNIPRLDCVNSSVMTIKGHLRRAEDNNMALEEAIAKSNLKSARKYLADIYSSYGEVKQAEIKLKSCENEVMTTGDKPPIVNFKEGKVIVEKDYLEKNEYNPMNISFDNNSKSESNVDLEPVEASPYF